jgi:hypothetical protein
MKNSNLTQFLAPIYYSEVRVKHSQSTKYFPLYGGLRITLHCALVTLLWDINFVTVYRQLLSIELTAL